MTKNNFYKQVISDYFSFLKSPKSFLIETLNNFELDFAHKKLIGFVVFMHLYYLLNPAVLVGLNLVGIVYAFFSVGVFYYLSQICLENYQGQDTSYDPKKLYVFAYVFALAELTGLILHLIIFVFNLTFLFSFIGWILGFVFTLPVAILVIALKLSIFKVVDPSEFSLMTFFKLLLEAVVETVKNNFGYDAWRELWADYCGEK